MIWLAAMAEFGQSLFDRIEMIELDIPVGNDENPGVRPQRFDAGAKRMDQSAADDDVVTAVAERDLYDRRVGAKGNSHADACWIEDTATFRYAASAVITSATMASCGTSRDCTVRSASA